MNTAAPPTVGVCLQPRPASFPFVRGKHRTYFPCRSSFQWHALLIAFYGWGHFISPRGRNQAVPFEKNAGIIWKSSCASVSFYNQAPLYLINSHICSPAMGHAPSYSLAVPRGIPPPGCTGESRTVQAIRSIHSACRSFLFFKR